MKPHNLPSPAQIARRCAAIRRRWTPTDRARRMGRRRLIVRLSTVGGIRRWIVVHASGGTVWFEERFSWRDPS